MEPSTIEFADIEPGRFEIMVDGVTWHSRATLPLTLVSIRESRTNPRRHSFDPDKLAELAESIKLHGVLQPVLVRPTEDGGEHAFELVAGHRRFRASQAAGLTEIPATVRMLTDREVLEIQVIENLQREDLHPLDEAEGFLQLHQSHGYAAEELAAKVGKSKGYVYARLKLCSLPASVKKLFLEDKLDASRALLIARIPDPKMAEQAAKEITEEDRWEGPMSYREAKDHIQREYMLQLSGAPFDTKSEDLVPKAGPCTTCPKRTGNQPDIFGDCRADVCTDPKCFQQKADASWKLQRVEAADAGHTVLEGKQADRFANNSYSSGHVRLDEQNYDLPKQPSWSHLTNEGEDLKKTFVRKDDGQVRVYVERKAALVKAKELGKIKKLPEDRDTGSRSRQVSAEEKRHKFRLKVIDAVLPDLVIKAEEHSDRRAFHRFLVETLVSIHSDPVRRVEKRRKIDFGKRTYSSPDGKALASTLAEMDGDYLQGLIVELIAVDQPSSAYSGGYGRGWTKACALLGIDMKAAEASVREREKKPLKLPKKAKAVKVPAPTKKAAKKVRVKSRRRK